MLGVTVDACAMMGIDVNSGHRQSDKQWSDKRRSANVNSISEGEILME